MQEAGYYTSIIGKWHLESEPVPFTGGFDYFNILNGQGEYYNPEFSENGVVKNYTGHVINITANLTKA